MCGAALDGYRAALRNVAHYAIDLDGEITANYRQALLALAADAEGADLDAFIRLLRDYRGQAFGYVNRLCEELAITGRSLRQIVDSLAEVDGDSEGRMQNALARLRTAVRSVADRRVGDVLGTAVAAIQEGLEGIHQQHEGTVSQLLAEIRTLHRSIDSLESAVSLDRLTALLTRAEMEKRIGALPAGESRLMLVRATGLRAAEGHFNSQVAAQLAAAFLKRLVRILPPETVIGRWSEEEFMVVLPEEQELALEEQLSGSYACTQEGKSVRPALQVRVMPDGIRPKICASC